MTGAASRRLLTGLLPEAARAFWQRLLAPIRITWRRNWFYRGLLKGPLADRIAFRPYDALPRKLEDAESLLRGRFIFAGQIVEVKAGSIFDKPPPSQAWLEALHAFEWLPPLSAAGGDAARTLATNLITQWLKRNSRYNEPAWLPHIMARRLENLFAHNKLILANSDVMWRSRVFVGLREQTRMLARIAGEAPQGLAKLEVATAVVLSGVCLVRNEPCIAIGLNLLNEEIAKQVLADGGHVSRSPSQLAHAYRLLTLAIDALTAAGQEIPKTLRSAHDRMAPMLRFFRHGDGRLALFNGGDECDARMIQALLARDEVHGLPFGHAPHSGFHRLAASRTLVVMDCGQPPPLAYAGDAHAGCLSFELSVGQQRVVVNCGAATIAFPAWDDALCATAAHSTLTLDDTSTGTILPDGWLRRLVGRRLVGSVTAVESKQAENADGRRVDASHGEYEAQFGLRHERQVVLYRQGLTLTGQDRLVPSRPNRRRGVENSFAVRFHIHPDVRVSSSQDGDFLLKLPDGSSWRFRADGGQVSLEESVYLGDETVRRAEQLVVTGVVRDSPVEVAWAFEEMGPFGGQGKAHSQAAAESGTR
jgi:uncharacterized heparinase superfamily protein